MRYKTTTTDFLTPSSGFLDGAATIFDLLGSFYEYNESKTDEQADFKAIENDWKVIGQDLKDTYAAEKAKQR